MLEAAAGQREGCSVELLEAAAEQLAKDRRRARETRQLPLPGQAEYLDLLRALQTLEAEPQAQLQRINTLARYTFRKHPEAPQ